VPIYPFSATAFAAMALIRGSASRWSWLRQRVKWEGNDYLYGGAFDTPSVKDILSAGDTNDVLNVVNKPAFELCWPPS